MDPELQSLQRASSVYGHLQMRKGRLLRWILILSAIICASVLGAIQGLKWYQISREYYYIHQKFIGLWVPPPPSLHRPNRNAIITSLWTSDYAISAEVLGHSITRYSTGLEESSDLGEKCASVDMVLIHLPGVIDERRRKRLERVGWKLVPVERVYGPRNIAKEEWRPNYTKFRAFNFTQYDHILMLDSDTLVLSPDIYGIFDLDLDFAGVTDQYTDRPFNQPINGGVLYYRPSQELTRFVLSKVNSTDYWQPEAEQSLIRTFLKHVTTHLPIEWNVSLMGKATWMKEWALLRPRFKILHYTRPKPFLWHEHAFAGTIWKDEVALWWKVRREMEELHGS